MVQKISFLIVILILSGYVNSASRDTKVLTMNGSQFIKLNIDSAYNNSEVQLAEIEFYDNGTFLDVEIVEYSNEYHNKKWSHEKIIDGKENTTWANGDSYDGKFPHWFIFKFKDGNKHQFNKIRIYTGTQSNHKYRLSNFSIYTSNDKNEWAPAFTGKLDKKEKNSWKEFQTKSLSQVNNNSAEQVHLTVNAPENSIVKILNIAPKYKDNIQLARGKYHIEVSKSGYVTHREWYEIAHSESITIDLRKRSSPKINAEGSVIWGQEHPVSAILNNIVKFQSKLYTKVRQTEEKMTHHQASNYCNSLPSNGSNWKLPSLNELKALDRSDVKLTLEFGRGKPTWRSNELWTSTQKDGGYMAFNTNSNNHASYDDQDTSAFVTCTLDTDVGIALEPYANKLIEQQSRNNSRLILSTKPMLKAVPTKEVLTKGEFETSSKFELRQQSVNTAYLRHIKEIEVENEQLLEQWKIKVAEEKKSHKDRLTLLKNSSNERNLGLVSKAMTTVYGKPKVLSSQYNADKEEFEIEFISQQSSMRPQLKNLNNNKNLINSLTSNQTEKNNNFELLEAYQLQDLTLLKVKFIGKNDYQQFGQSYYYKQFWLNTRDLKYVIYQNRLIPQSRNKIYIRPGIKKNSILYLAMKPRANSTVLFISGSGEERNDKVIQLNPKIKSRFFGNKDHAFYEKVTVPVKLKYARQFKSMISHPDFIPTIVFKLEGSKLIFDAIDELKDPEYLVIEKAFNDASANSNNMRDFIKTYPQSDFSDKAKMKLAQLIKQEEGRKQDIARANKAKQLEKAKKDAENLEKQRLANIAKERAERDFVTLGSCEIGNTVYHREQWNTTTSSGNIIADSLFGAATKEEFIIIYEGVVKGFVGEKVEVIINDYGVKQTLGGGFLQPSTWRKYDLNKHADKYLGKTQFYDKARCN